LAAAAAAAALGFFLLLGKFFKLIESNNSFNDFDLQFIRLILFWEVNNTYKYILNTKSLF
jgi:hypothetical protein